MANGKLIVGNIFVIGFFSIACIGMLLRLGVSFMTPFQFAITFTSVIGALLLAWICTIAIYAACVDRARPNVWGRLSRRDLYVCIILITIWFTWEMCALWTAHRTLITPTYDFLTSLNIYDYLVTHSSVIILSVLVPWIFYLCALALLSLAHKSQYNVFA